MIGSIGNDGASASGVANAFLRALGSTQGRGRAFGTETKSKVAPSDGVQGKSELTEEERQEVDELKQRDQEVRRHESAHKAAAGQFAKGAATYEYTQGPDGKRYASGGEVSIDTSEVSGDPQATIRKMQQIRRAAGAPSEPSSQDRQVAAQASLAEAQARQETTEARRENGGKSTGKVGKNGGKSAFPPSVFDTQASSYSPGSFIDLTV